MCPTVLFIYSTSTKNSINNYFMQEKIIAIWNGRLYQKMRNMWLTFCISVCIPCSFLQQKQHKKLTSLYALHHKVPSNKMVDQWHMDKCQKSIKKRRIWKAVLTILASHDDYLVKAATSQNFILAPPTHPFSGTIIGCHVPSTHFPACSLALQLHNSLYIHHNLLIFNIFAFITLRCSSMRKTIQYTN